MYDNNYSTSQLSSLNHQYPIRKKPGKAGSREKIFPAFRLSGFPGNPAFSRLSGFPANNPIILDFQISMDPELRTSGLENILKVVCCLLLLI